MKVLRLVSSVVVSWVVFAVGAGQAGAISLPDNSSCSTTSSNGCLKISNTATNGSAIVGSGAPGVTGIGVGTNAPGVVGTSTSGAAMIGASSSGTGVAGTSSSSYGVQGLTNGSGTIAAVYGNNGSSTDGYGVLGQVRSDGSGSAIYGDAGGSFAAWAGNFNGDVTGRDFYGNTFNPSDARLKKDIANAPYGLKEVMKLRPVTYSWNEPEKHGNGRQVGLIAQEVQPIIPELVKSRGPDATLALNYAGLVPVLVKAVQEQQAVIQEQGREIAALQVERKGSASLPSGGTGVALAFGLLPIGLFVGRRLRRR